GLAHLIPAGAVEKEVVVRGAPLPPHGDLHYLLARLDPRGAAPTIAVPIGGGGHDLRLAVPAVGGAEVGRHARRAGLVRRAGALLPADSGAGGDGLAAVAAGARVAGRDDPLGQHRHRLSLLRGVGPCRPSMVPE